MSNQTKNNKLLKDLLDAKAESFDAFEKEAIEGFSMMADKEEVLKLKEELDAAIHKKLWEKENKKVFNYWYAAAGLFLVVGLSIYFITAKPVIETKLALKYTPPAEVNTIQQATISEKLKGSDVENDKNSEALISKENQPPRERTPLLIAEEKIRDAATKKPAVVTVDEKNGLSETKYNAGSEAQIAAASPAVPPAKAITQQIADDNGDMTAALNTGATEAVAQNNKEDEVNSTTARRVEPAARAQVLKMQKKQSAAVYKTGNQQLKRELEEKLKRESLNENFEALLRIESDGSVSNVELTRTDNLNETQQKRLILVLKSFNQFLCKPNGSGENYCLYNLVFKP